MSASSAASPNRRRRLSDTPGNAPKRTKRSSAYDDNFEQRLIDYKIYPDRYRHADGRSQPKPENLDDLIRALSDRHASLSPSRFTEEAFQKFTEADNDAISKATVLSTVVPVITGAAKFQTQGTLSFTNLASMTKSRTVDPIPDLFDGAHAGSISKAVKKDLEKVIVPTNHGNAPVLPNFFLEGRSPFACGPYVVAKRKACQDGAVGARAMHSLQNYGEDNPVYDGKAHTFSATYQAGAGMLQLYAHHITGPARDGGLPEYHMTLLRGYHIGDDREGFVRGVTAFRNLRDLAHAQRERFIRAANSKSAPKTAIYADQASMHGSTTSESEAAQWRDSDDDLEQQMADA